MNEAARAKTYWSTHHFQSARLADRDNANDQRYRWHLADFILSLHPASVLEFGCSSARNLAALHCLDPDLDLHGIDCNETTLQLARNVHPHMSFTLGDESALAALPDNAVDVAFTCSVLDHIPAPEWHPVYADLVRVAKKAVVLLEPLVRVNDLDVDADFVDLGIDAVPYTYAHNYLTHDPAVRLVQPLPCGGPPWPEFAKTYHLLVRPKQQP